MRAVGVEAIPEFFQEASEAGADSGGGDEFTVVFKEWGEPFEQGGLAHAGGGDDEGGAVFAAVL